MKSQCRKQHLALLTKSSRFVHEDLLDPPPPAVLQQNEWPGQASFGTLPALGHDQPELLEQLDACQDPTTCLADRKMLLESEAIVRRNNPNGFGPCPGQVFWELNSDRNLPACNLLQPGLQGLHHLGTCHWCTREIVSPLPQPGAQRNAFTCVCRIRVRAAYAREGGGPYR